MDNKVLYHVSTQIAEFPEIRTEKYNMVIPLKHHTNQPFGGITIKEKISLQQ